MSSAQRYYNIEGYVWCDKHGEIHDSVWQEFDPYDLGEDFCEPEDHRAVAMLATAEEMA